MNVKRLTRDALLTSVALTIFMVEAQINIPIPVQGLKLGLSNVMTLYALFAIGPWDALAILLCRIFFGSLFSGQMMGFMYSLSGGLLCYAVTLALRPLMGQKQVWLCGIMGAMAHNVGQMACAVAVTGTPSLMVYLPVLMICALFTGAFTGYCAQLLLSRGDLR